MGLQFEYDFEVTKAALLYLAEKSLQLDKYLAVKLLFLADRGHLLRFGRPITGDSYKALPFGPVPDQTLGILDAIERSAVSGLPLGDDPRVRDLFAALELDLRHKYPRYSAKVKPDLSVLSETDLMLLDETVAEYGNAAFGYLFDLTHSLKAYTNVWREDVAVRRFPMRFEDFFQDAPSSGAVLEELEDHERLTALLAEI